MVVMCRMDSENIRPARNLSKLGVQTIIEWYLWARHCAGLQKKEQDIGPVHKKHSPGILSMSNDKVVMAWKGWLRNLVWLFEEAFLINGVTELLLVYIFANNVEIKAMVVISQGLDYMM